MGNVIILVIVVAAAAALGLLAGKVDPAPSGSSSPAVTGIVTR